MPVLNPLLRILVAGFKDTVGLGALLRRRFKSSTTVEQQSAFLAALCQISPGEAIDELDAKLQGLSRKKQTMLMQFALPSLFGGRWEMAECHLIACHSPFWSGSSS